jgi:hypothetical protein
MASASRLEFLHQLYNHVALPRDVPGKEDGNLHHIDAALLKRMLDAVEKITPITMANLQPCMNGLRDTLRASQILNINGTIGKSALIKEFRSLNRANMLVLHLAPQNCGLLIYHQVGYARAAYHHSASLTRIAPRMKPLSFSRPSKLLRLLIKYLQQRVRFNGIVSVTHESDMGHVLTVVL